MRGSLQGQSLNQPDCFHWQAARLALIRARDVICQSGEALLSIAFDPQLCQDQHRWHVLVARPAFGRLAPAQEALQPVGIKPVSYSIPDDGPVGQLLRALGRHPFRPAHIHLLISADGFVPLTTHLFVKGDTYLDSDAVFGTKDSLVVDFVRHTSMEEAARYHVTPPFYTVEYTFVLNPL
jgi:hypothetical protein